MKISILLPYKENFTPDYAGAVSLFLNDTIKLSKYKKNIQVFGNTSFKKKLLTNYTNLKFTKLFFILVFKTLITELDVSQFLIIFSISFLLQKVSIRLSKVSSR